MERVFRQFSYKEANFRIASSKFSTITNEIVQQREILEAYIRRIPEFMTSLVPIPPLPHAPRIAQMMHEAAFAVGVGPMAAVAGAFAQIAAEKALTEGADEAIVENGGDIFIVAKDDVVIGLYAGIQHTRLNLGFLVRPSDTPLSICSSSGMMGHSLSLGACDLATVVSKRASIADAAATKAANLVQTARDISRAIETICAIPGVEGVLIVKDGKIGKGGKLPLLVRTDGRDVRSKITRDRMSSYHGKNFEEKDPEP